MKLHSRLERYLGEIETALTPTRANLRIRVRFVGGQLLAISEAVVVTADALVHMDTIATTARDRTTRCSFATTAPPTSPISRGILNTSISLAA